MRFDTAVPLKSDEIDAEHDFSYVTCKEPWCGGGLLSGGGVRVLAWRVVALVQCQGPWFYFSPWRHNTQYYI